MTINSESGRALIAGGRSSIHKGDSMAEESKKVATEIPPAGDKRPKKIACTAVRFINGIEVENEETGKKKLVEPGDDLILPYDMALRLANGTSPRIVIGEKARAAAKKAAARQKQVRENRQKEREAFAKQRRALVGG